MTTGFMGRMYLFQKSSAVRSATRCITPLRVALAMVRLSQGDQVPHGMENEVSTRLTIDVPDGVLAVKPERHEWLDGGGAAVAGWRSRSPR